MAAGIRRKMERFSRGLRGKFILLISALLITTTMALGWIFLVREVRDEGNKLAEEAVFLAGNLAGTVELGLYTRNREALAAPVEEVLKHTEVAFVTILDEEGQPVFTRAASGFTLPELQWLRQPAEERKKLETHRRGEGSVRLIREPRRHEEFYLAEYPVLTEQAPTAGEEIGFLPERGAREDLRHERIGSALVGLSTREMRSEVRRLERALGFATLAVIAIGIFLTVPLVKIIAEPMNQLAEATRRIAEGDLGILLHLNAQDEIGDLARSFNQMTLRLQKSREELERTNQQLEQKVQERSRELEEAQHQLVQAEKMSVVGQLVSGVAHELNNPLAGVLGYSQLLLRMPVEEEVRRGLEKIEAEAERCKRIVQNLLMFARRNKPQKRPMDLNSVVESVLQLKEYQFKVENIQVLRDLAPDLPRTMADAGQFQQVVMNVIHNAQQAMREVKSPAVLTVRTSCRDGRLELSISDTGPGIPPENLSRIFDPFFTTKEVGQGTGLGLSICYGIVQEHRGRIWAESQPGAGSTFRMELPVFAEDSRSGRESDEAGGETFGGSPAAESREPARILVVDDEASIVDILHDVLCLDGHRIETAVNGRLALVKLAEQPFDVVISDLKMPGMSGQELYQYLARHGSPLRSRIIFTTGDLASPETQGFLQQSGSPFLQKPFDLNEVRRLVQEVLARGSEGRGDLPSIIPGGIPGPDRAS